MDSNSTQTRPGQKKGERKEVWVGGEQTPRRRLTTPPHVCQEIPGQRGGGEKRLGWSGGKEERREGGKEGGFRAKGQEVRMEGRRQEGRRECGILEDTRAGGNNDNNNLM